MFSSLDDKALLSLGVPEELLALVRGVTSDEELDAIQSRLPVEAYEGLFLVAAGDTVSQVLHNREARVDLPVDTEDFVAALETPESRARFVVVSDDESLMTILNAPLAQWRIFLHPTQQRLAIGDRSGPVRVLGGAGTGKTVLAMHRVKWLAENRTTGKQKVLFTTFTKNLAADIEQNLKTLCLTETLAKIEVRNLDAWVHGFMRSQKLEQRIVYDRKAEGASQAWKAALAVKDGSLDLPDDFYEQELAHVVLAQGITTLDAYRTARRTGRGVLLSRAKRDAVWPVFEEYRGQLASRKLKDVDDAYREVATILDAQALENEQLTLGRLTDVMMEHMHDSPAAFMAHIVHHYVLLQHFGIVQERAARDGRSRYVLLKGDLGLERTGNGENFVRIDMMTDRLRNALLLATQCDLLAHNEEAGMFSLTPEGMRRLQTVTV